MKDKKKQIEICENCKIADNCSHRILTHMEKCKVNDCDYFQNISIDKEMIEEMAKDLYGEIDYDVNYYNDDNYSEVDFDYKETAKNIVEKGWVKLLENSVVLSDKQCVEIVQDNYNIGYERGSKETAEKIMQDLKPLLEGFVHTDTGENLYVYKCKQFDVEIKE